MVNNIIEEDIINIVNSEIDWSKFFGKTILITGASGFLPAYMVETLNYINEINTNAKIKIIALVRNKKKAESRFSHFLKSNNFILLHQDVCNKIEIKENIHFIIHAASQASPKFYGIDPVGTINANIIGTSNLLDLAHRKKVEGFLYFSSSEIYGKLDNSEIPTKETFYGSIDSCKIRSCYSEGKKAGETICISWFHQYGVPVFITRPFHTYGPGMSLEDGRVYADFIRDIIYNKDIVLTSDGSAIRAFCYVADATKAFFNILLKGEQGNAYNVGNDKGVASIIELAELLIKLFPDKKLKIIQSINNSTNYIKSEISINIPNIEKISKLGWFPETPIKEGFLRTIMSYNL